MKEVTLKESDVGLKVFVNGEPDLKELPADELKVFVTALEILIEKRFNSYIKRRRWHNENKFFEELMAANNLSYCYRVMFW